MPVNTSSTGATYGKSTDPLCPLGFHPQVRWPTRCKRCFRDYKEHTDESDKAKFSSIARGASQEPDDDPWSARRSGFQRSRSLDVNMMESTSKYVPSNQSNVTSSYASRTTTNTNTTSATTDDMPQWKKNMLERQKKEDEAKAAAAAPKPKPTPAPVAATSTYTSRFSSSSSATASATPNTTAEEDYISRRRRERAQQEEEKKISHSFRSRSVQPESSSSGYESTPEVTTTKTSLTTSSTRSVTFAEPAASTKPAPNTSNYGSYSNTPTTTTSSSYGSSYSSSYSTSTSTPTTTTAASNTYSTSSYSSTSNKNTSTTTNTSYSTAQPKTEAKQEEPAPSWKKSTPSWKKPVEEEKPKEAVQPSWKKSLDEKTKPKPALEKISETPASTSPTTAKTPSWKKKVEEVKQDTPQPAPSPAPASKPSTPSWKKSSTSSTSSTDTSATANPYGTTSSSNSYAADKTKSTPNPYGSSNSTSGTKEVTKEVIKTVVDDTKVKKLESEMEDMKHQITVLKREKSNLQREIDSSASKKPLTFDSAKAAESSAELRRAKDKLGEYELSVAKLEKEKNAMNLKIKELESSIMTKKPGIGSSKDNLEMQAKVKFLENKCHQLEQENDDLQSNVQNLEGELEEVQDNFREDEADEYRHIKRDLETQSKNVRVLQFKLKKAERSLSEVSAEKTELENRTKSGTGSSFGSDSSSKVRTLERELEQKSAMITKYEQQIAELRSGSKLGSKGGPVLSRTGSVEKNMEDQLLKDLQDSIERENDLKEQLSMAEDEAGEMRKKLSRIEDENESLAQQLKKMAKGSKTRSPSPGQYGRAAIIEKDEGISADGEELSLSELKVQLEVSEGETGLLRKKVDNLLTENLKLTKEIKEINSRLADEKKKKSTTSSYGSYGKTQEKGDSYYEGKIDEIQTELNSTRVKLIEKEREVERLDAQVKSAPKTTGKGKLNRSGSQDEDLAKKIQVIEQEANVLRGKVTKLETENEKLSAENKTLQAAKTKKPANTQEKLQMDKFALEEKVKKLESTIKEQNKKVSDLQEAANYSKKSSSEVERLNKELTNMEFELTKVKSASESDKKQVVKLERELTSATDKAEKAQREVVTAEREKRKAEEDKNKHESSVSKLEADIRTLNREKDRLREESDDARRKNRDNLKQTEEGLKAFKDQIESLKNDIQEEKNKHRESKRIMDEKVKNVQSELRESKHTTEQKVRLCEDLEEKVKDLDDKWAKSKRINKQKTEKVEQLELQIQQSGTANSTELTQLKTKLKNAEKDLDAKESKIKDLQKAGGVSTTLQAENDKLKKEVEDLKKKSAASTSSYGSSSKEIKELKDQIAKLENSEETIAIAKAKAVTAKEDMESELGDLKKDYDTIKGELSALRHTYNTKADDWIKEKLDLQQRMKDLQDSLLSSAGEGWETERDRFKQIIDDRDNQLTQLKIEGDVTRSQLSTTRKEVDDLKLKLLDYEKMNKYQKTVKPDSAANSDLEQKLNEAKKQISTLEKERKSESNNMKLKYDGKIAVMQEEVASLKSQASKYRRERENYKEMLESAQKSRSGRTSGGDEVSEVKNKVSDLQYQIHALEDELSEAKLGASKAQAQATAQKSSYEIQLAELNSKINEMEEESLIETGRARIAGTRTKMELAWQKERESQKKLINELNTMSRDLKATLLEVEKERDRERLEAKRKITGMKSSYEEEQDDTKKQITDLQYDLLELRDAHAKLRTTNEKLRRDKDKFERERDEFRYMAKERTRTEEGEGKKVGRLLKDMEDFLTAVPQVLGDGALKPSGEISVAARIDTSTKSSFKQLLVKLQDSKSELEALHRMNEEEREKITAKRALMKRTGSVENENGTDSPRGRTPGASSRTSSSGHRFKKSVSIGETITEGDTLWQSTDTRGSNESLASNASIPLPIPVRTRSSGGSSETGYSSDYNALSIRRLERDTSVDRLSTGSRESGMSTQSDWVGEKKKKAGLIGKLKKLTKNKDDKEFGSGSDISSVSVSSNISSMSAFAKAARKRATSRDRSKEPEKPKDPKEANEPFDKYFNAAANSGVGTSNASGGNTLPRSYRRF